MANPESHARIPENLEIRELQANESEQLHEFRRRAWADSSLTDQELELLISFKAVPLNPISQLVAVRHEDIIGTFGYFKEEVNTESDKDITRELNVLHGRGALKRPIGNTAIFGHIFELAVDPEWRRRKIGTSLIMAGMQHMQQSDIDLHKFYLRNKRERTLSPDTFRHHGVVKVRSGIKGIKDHSDFIRTLYAGVVNKTSESLSSDTLKN
jgi:GNAT superfamily N-acetyltransferase